LRTLALAALAAAALLAGCATNPRALNEPDFRILERVMDLVERKDYATAETTLAPLLTRPPSYTAAVAHQTLAFIRSMQDRPAEAAVEFELALVGDFFPPETTAQIRQNQAVLFVRSGQCAKAMPYFNQLAGVTAPRHVRIAQLCCYAEASRFDEAATLYQSVVRELKDPRAEFLALGQDIELARAGKVFPPGRFSRFMESDPKPVPTNPE
jgi:Tfp pilus assembly protein PilF